MGLECDEQEVIYVYLVDDDTNQDLAKGVLQSKLCILPMHAIQSGPGVLVGQCYLTFE